jgi:hypothetical protein
MIPWSAIFDRGGWALAGVAFMLVFFGLLVPRRVLKERDDALAKERQRSDNLAESIKSLLAYAEAADKILSELNRRAQRRRGRDDDPYTG